MKSVLFVGRILVLGWLLGSFSVLAQEIRQPIERNGRIAITCLTGDVVVTGGEDAVLTVATDGDPSAVQVKRRTDGTYGISVEPPMKPHRLRIGVPRDAHLTEVRTRSANVSVRTVATALVMTVSGKVSLEQVLDRVAATTTSGDVRVSSVGAAEVRTVSGNLSLQDITGNVAVSTVSGKLEASNIGGDLTGQLVSGEAVVRCIRGRVDVTTVSGNVNLSRLENEIAVETTSGNVVFVGALTPVKRCRISAFSGDIKLAVPETCGFEAKFKSFSGTIKSDFPLDAPRPSVDVRPDAPTPPPPPPPLSSRPGSYILWRHGDGAAKVSLNTFSGKVLLVRAAAASEPPCRQP